MVGEGGLELLRPLDLRAVPGVQDDLDVAPARSGVARGTQNRPVMPATIFNGNFRLLITRSG